MPGFKQQTVLVIGAGAHVDYGMPTGKQFRDGLCNWAEAPEKAPDEWKQAMMLLAPEAWEGAPSSAFFPNGGTAKRTERLEQIKTLAEKIGASPYESIDALLEKHPTFEGLGREVVVAVIHQYEQRALARGRIEGIYRWLVSRCATFAESYEAVNGWNALRQPPHAFENVTIVTFNYDRLAEWHLELLIENAAEHGNQRNLPKIYHVYGKLAGQHTRAGNRFTCNHGQETVRQSAECIQIASSRAITGKSEELDSARIAIANASQIAFLGFAFDPVNLKRVGFPENLDENVRLFASAYDEGERFRQRLKQSLGTKLTIGGSDKDCVECLKEWESFC